MAIVGPLVKWVIFYVVHGNSVCCTLCSVNWTDLPNLKSWFDNYSCHDTSYNFQTAHNFANQCSSVEFIAREVSAINSVFTSEPVSAKPIARFTTSESAHRGLKHFIGNYYETKVITVLLHLSLWWNLCITRTQRIFKLNLRLKMADQNTANSLSQSCVPFFPAPMAVPSSFELHQ